MPRYHDLTATLAARVADGDLPPGATLPSVRALALAEGTTATTVARAYRELAEAGVIVVEPRRAARVSPGGLLAARALLRQGALYRLAGSDDPALSALLADVPDAIVSVGAAGSYRGLSALWSGRADGASLHLRHRDGEYNASVRPWRPRRPRTRPRPPLAARAGPARPARQPPRRRRARRPAIAARRAPPTGTGTRTLLDRLLLDAGIDPESIAGPTVELHLDVALAVATGEADAGLGLRSAATPLGLDFVPLSWEPFQVATTRAQSGGLRPLLDALATTAVAERIAALGGYDIAGAGEIIDVA